MSYDGFIEFDAFNTDLKKIIERMMSGFERAIKNENLKGNLEIGEIDRPGVKGYSIRGHFGSHKSLEPFDPLSPFDPLEPSRPFPRPERPWRAQEGALKKSDEALTDVFEDEKTIKIYLEVRGEDKKDIQLNVTANKVEVKGKNFYKVLNLPTSNIDLEKTSSKYKNGVLEVIISKKETLEANIRKIDIG